MRCEEVDTHEDPLAWIGGGHKPLAVLRRRSRMTMVVGRRQAPRSTDMVGAIAVMAVLDLVLVLFAAESLIL